jgi:hypothetical protein
MKFFLFLSLHKIFISCFKTSLHLFLTWLVFKIRFIFLCVCFCYQTVDIFFICSYVPSFRTSGRLVLLLTDNGYCLNTFLLGYIKLANIKPSCLYYLKQMFISFYGYVPCFFYMLTYVFVRVLLF